MIKEQILALLEERKFKELKELLETVHPVDIAEMLEDISKKQMILIFRLLAKEEAAGKLRFHAKWNRAADPEKTDRWPDAQFLYTEGRGRYVGTSLHVYKEIGTGDPAYQPDWWWGEGDEKFFVDGEKFPSWFGTGSEDYFGYAWGTWRPFDRPYHSQPYGQICSCTPGFGAEGNDRKGKAASDSEGCHRAQRRGLFCGGGRRGRAALPFHSCVRSDCL